MTSKLVCANITSVMEDERRKQTEQNLIESGKAEFLKKGYAKANLRDICKTAGVTTGAFYFSFANKEALLAAILDPVIADYERMCLSLIHILYIHGTVDLLKRGCIFTPMYITADRMSDYERAGVLVNEWRLWTWKMNLKRQQLESR